MALCQLSFQISADRREAETSANVNKHWKTCAKGNDAITYVISTNQHFILTFSKQIFKFQRCSCKLSFLFPPHCQSKQIVTYLWATAEYPAHLISYLKNCSPQSCSCDLLGQILIWVNKMSAPAVMHSHSHWKVNNEWVYNYCYRSPVLLQSMSSNWSAYWTWYTSAAPVLHSRI